MQSSKMETFDDEEINRDADFQGGEKLVFDINDLQEEQEVRNNGKEDDTGLIEEEEDRNETGKDLTLTSNRDDQDAEPPVQIVTSLVDDIDVNSEYMYNNWYTGSGKSEDGRSDDDVRGNSISSKDDASLSDQESSKHRDSRTNIRKEELQEHGKDEGVIEENDSGGVAMIRDALADSNNAEKTQEQSHDDRNNVMIPDKSDNPKVHHVDGLLKSANADVTAHKYKKAVSKYEEALAMATEVNDKFLIQSCACNLGAVLVILGQAQKAVDILHKQLEKDLQQTNGTDTNALGDIYYNLGLAYDANGDPKSAIKCFQWAVGEFEKWKNNRGKADAYNQMAELEAKQQNVEKARKNYSKAAEHYSQVGNGLMKARMLVKEARMLNVLVDTENFHQVVRKCEEASTAVLKQNDSKGNTVTKEAKLFHDMAVLRKKLGNNEEALRWLEESWKKCRGSSGAHPTREDIRLQAAVAQSLARMYLHSYDLINAVEIYQEAASLHGLLENYVERGWCFYYMAEAYRQLCDYSNAERSYHVAYQTLTDAGDYDYLWKISDGLGDLNAARNHPDIATMYYREALAKDAPVHSRTKSSTDRIIKKLTRSLENQKSHRLSMYESRQKRVPFVVGYDLQMPLPPINGISETNFDGNSNSISSTPKAVFKGVRDRYPQATSTPMGASSMSKVAPRMRSPIYEEIKFKDKKRLRFRRSRKKKGKRKGQSDLPVARGVGAYDSGSDLSLVNGSMASLVKEAYTRSDSFKGRENSAFLTVKSRHRGRRSVTPHQTSSEEETEDDDEEEVKESHSSDSGFKNMWQRAKDLVSRLKSDSEDSQLSSSKEEDEGIQSKESVKLENTYENPSQLLGNDLYSTVNKKGATQRSTNSEEPIYETLPTGTKTSFGASMPTRPPPPPAVPIKSHPSLNKKKTKTDINKPSTSYDEDEDDSFTSVTEDELESLQETVNIENKNHYPTVARMTRGGLEAGLWEIQKLEHEREGIRLSNQSSVLSSEPTKQQSSKVCSIM